MPWNDLDNSTTCSLLQKLYVCKQVSACTSVFTVCRQWWTADPDSKLFKTMTEAIRQEWGCKPLPVREGGTMPCASMLETILGAPAVLLPMGQNSDNCHLANEKLRKMNLIKGKNVIRRIIEGFGEAQ